MSPVRANNKTDNGNTHGSFLFRAHLALDFLRNHAVAVGVEGLRGREEPTSRRTHHLQWAHVVTVDGSPLREAHHGLLQAEEEEEYVVVVRHPVAGGGRRGSDNHHHHHYDYHHHHHHY